MSAINNYYTAAAETLERVFDTQKEPMERAASVIAGAILEKRGFFAFGCNHAGILALELFYRAGGLVPVNPIRAPGMMLELTPVTMTTKMERMDGYGRIILDDSKIKDGDVLLIHSVSGRNPVSIDMAIRARERDISLIVITNMKTALSVSSRHPSGKLLYHFADILIDNCGPAGDAAVHIPGVPQNTGPTSTVAGAAIVNAIAARTIELIARTGVTPPVFLSANLDGGDEHNRKALAEYEGNIFYM